MAKGNVKWFNDAKGFGFITPEDGGKDLFVHHTGINGQGFRTLPEGAKVTYEAEAGPKGPKAVDFANDFTETYAVIEGKEKILEELKAAAKKVDNVMLATDPDVRAALAAFPRLGELLGAPTAGR